MILSRYFVWFIAFSVLGWLYETTYCTIKEGVWQNRGFLYGPLCPIYGSGAVALMLVAELLETNYGIRFVWWQTFLIAFSGSIVLEYSTSWILEKLFHAYWWDYHDMPLNINGRVCLPASIAFGLAGLLILYILAPICIGFTEAHLSPLMLELLGLLLMGILGADLALTVSALTDFSLKIADAEANLDLHMELFVMTVQEKSQDVSKKLADEKERFASEHLERTVTHMNGVYRSALKRVQGFRPAVTGKMSPKRLEMAQKLLARLRNR